jgi:glycerol-3-phosphate dehydrogenase
MIQQLEATKQWDICIIGGGATGLGTAVDAASRGYKTILLEKIDFAKGTSSRSTKLVHGGVRYLQQGNIKLVMEALKERGLLMKNASHLVRNQSFVVPNYKWWEGPFYGIGLKVYDWMAGSLGLGPSQFLSKEEILQHAPTLETEGLRGGIIYYDGQFDDARLAIALALTAAEQNATLLNYFEVKSFLKSANRIEGVAAIDTINKKEYEIRARCVINATGVFGDTLMKMDDDQHHSMITLSQGIHLVVDKDFLPGDAGIMIPRTDDGRVLFAVPWHGKCILGTTDTPITKLTDEPVALHAEIEFILSHISRYLSKKPGINDVCSVFAGLRPLVKSSNKKTAELSRDHLVSVSDSGLLSITGGKWTTYRKMAEDTVDLARDRFGLPLKTCNTRDLPLAGCIGNADDNDKNQSAREYVEDAVATLKKNGDSTATENIHSALQITKGQIRVAVQNEMCMTVDDALSRRTRALFLNAKAAIESAPLVAKLMAAGMDKDETWIHEQVNAFNEIAKNYLVAK